MALAWAMTWLGLYRVDKPAIHAVKTCVIDLIKLPFLHPVCVSDCLSICYFVCVYVHGCVCVCLCLCCPGSMPRACFVYCLLFEQTDKQIGLRQSEWERGEEKGTGLGLVAVACWQSASVRLFVFCCCCCCRTLCCLMKRKYNILLCGKYCIAFVYPATNMRFYFHLYS